MATGLRMRCVPHSCTTKWSWNTPIVVHLQSKRRTSCAASTADATAAAAAHQDDERWMNLALQQAQTAYDAGEVPIGAVLVINGEVAAAAYNLTETKKNPLSHAELLCISAAAEQQLAWRLSEATLYSTVEPCPMCAGAILQARLARLVYGARQPRVGADGSWVALFPQAMPTSHNDQQGQTQANQPQQQQPRNLQQSSTQQAGTEQHTMAGHLQLLDGQVQQEHSDLDQQQQQHLQQQPQPLMPIGPHPFHPSIQVTGGVLADQCAHLMRAFFKQRRKDQKAQAQAAAAAATDSADHAAEKQHCTCNGGTPQQQAQQHTSVAHSTAAAAAGTSPSAAPAGQRDDASGGADATTSRLSSTAHATSWCAPSLWLGSSSLEDSDDDSTA